MQRSIKFTHNGSSSAFGNFAAGELLLCSAEQAKHLVEEAGCAVYTDANDGAGKEPAAPPEQPTARRKASPKR